MWRYTPRRLWAYLTLAERRRRDELAAQLALMRLAYHGDAETYAEQMDELRNGA